MSNTRPQHVEGQFVHTEYGGIGMKLSKRSAVIATVLWLTLGASAGAASAAETPSAKSGKVALTAEQKAAFESAKSQFKSAQFARQASLAAAKAAISTAKANFAAAVASASNAEEKKAARQTLKIAIEAAKASVLERPVRPSHP